MNDMVSNILEKLKQFPLTYEFAYAEQNGRGEDILVFSCRELPLRDFIYVPGKRGMTLGWDTAQCLLPPKVQQAFRQYYLDGLDYHRERCEEELEYYQEQLAAGPEEELHQEYESCLKETEEELQNQLSRSWEDYLRELLAELDASTSPLRTVDIPPMLAERWSWNTPEEVEPPFGLPTEDEWEYLCSGGVHTLFPWGDTLELELVCNEAIDKDAKNAFGLVIGHACRAERVSSDPWLLKGDDGGCALCGGEGDRAAFPYSPYFRYGLPRFSWTTGRDLEREMAKRWRRRVLRLTPDGD